MENIEKLEILSSMLDRILSRVAHHLPGELRNEVSDIITETENYIETQKIKYNTSN